MINAGKLDKLKTNNPLIGITLDREGEYVRVKRQYHEAVVKAGGIPVLVPFENDPFLIANTIDGLLIPGGGDIDPFYLSEKLYRPSSHKITPKERTDFEIALLRAIMKLGKPVMGICYGMQLINVALGGSIYEDLPSRPGTTIDHRKGNHRIVGKGNFINGDFIVNSSHHQAVRDLAKGLAVSALSDDDVVEAVTLSDYPFLIGVQWHPERAGDELSSGLFRSFVGSAGALK